MAHAQSSSTCSGIYPSGPILPLSSSWQKVTSYEVEPLLIFDPFVEAFFAPARPKNRGDDPLLMLLLRNRTLNRVTRSIQDTLMILFIFEGTFDL